MKWQVQKQPAYTCLWHAPQAALTIAYMALITTQQSIFNGLTLTSKINLPADWQMSKQLRNNQKKRRDED